MREPFPDLLDPSDYFNRFVLKSCSSETGKNGISYEMSYAAHTRLHQHLNIFINKVLHQGRGQGQRDLDESGVEL
jgi:hypothetical protein